MTAIFRTALIVITLLVASPQAQAAASAPDMREFALIPVLHEGRVKPLGSVARIVLKRLSGRESAGDLSATGWLAEALFDPATAAQRPVIALDRPLLRSRLGLPADTKTLSYAEASAALTRQMRILMALAEKPANALTRDDQALLDLAENTEIFGDILRSFSFMLPLDLAVPVRYTDQKTPPTYQTLKHLQDRLARDTRALIRRKGTDPQRYNPAEKQTAQLAFHLRQIAEGGARSMTFRVVPYGDTFLSPWEAFSADRDVPPFWSALAASWRDGEATTKTATWRDASRAAVNYAAQEHAAPRWRLALEDFYYRIHPWAWALGLYALALGTAFAAPRLKLPAHLPVTLATTGFGVHAAAIAARIAILGRPPVGTLYESLLFVSALCTLAALILMRRPHLKTAGLGALGAAAFLLALAPALVTRGESLEVLVAVLNTNFWLTTHVLCITAGYAACIVAACAAHMAMLQKISARPVRPVLLVALLLTAAGTALGGLWADQSWGRFWGWDPKENGALLIVLWIVWLLHGRMAGKLREPEFLLGAALLNIIVALAWFGVNLLGTGLHSYGFTTGLAAALAAFCAAQIVIALGLYRLALRQARRHT